MGKHCLIVVDMQNDFIDGALGFEGAEGIVAAVVQKIQAYQSRGDDVLYTMDTHDENYLRTEEGSHLPTAHCVKGTKGHRLHPDVEDVKRADERIFEKTTFPSLGLGNHLETRSFETIELVGLVSNICVLSNAVIAKAALPDARIVVDAAATASFDDDLHEKALDVLEGLHVQVTNRS